MLQAISALAALTDKMCNATFCCGFFPKCHQLHYVWHRFGITVSVNWKRLQWSQGAMHELISNFCPALSHAPSNLPPWFHIARKALQLHGTSRNIRDPGPGLSIFQDKKLQRVERGSSGSVVQCFTSSASVGSVQVTRVSLPTMG